ncbi:MAG: arginine deiminase family protein [Acidobacteria bacterium]|nr:arginine deiminase family protein [Acidobacteriota bacterium]
MVGKLKRVMVCSPRDAGWGRAERIAEWKKLGHAHEPNLALAQKQHAALRQELEAAGAEVIALPASEELTLDAVYAHDPSLMTDWGAICQRMGKPERDGEPAAHAAFYRALGIPVLGEITAPGLAEAGDMVWLDEKTLLVGRGYRTNAAGIEQLRALLAPNGVEVLAAPLPYGGGPKVCLHLMSLMSMLDPGTALVDLEWLAVETVELLLRERGLRFIEIDAAERATLACNVLSLGGGKLLALAENPKTNARLRAAGFDVRTFPGSELAINGGGGPTCLTRPILRGK